jgi:hypothetical protein
LEISVANIKNSWRKDGIKFEENAGADYMAAKIYATYNNCSTMKMHNFKNMEKRVK